MPRQARDQNKSRERKNVSNETLKRVRDAVRQNSYQEMLTKLQGLAFFWLVPLLKVWGNLEGCVANSTASILHNFVDTL
jgi:hypothetical protein